MNPPEEAKTEVQAIKYFPDPDGAGRYIFCSTCSQASEPIVAICREGHPICKNCFPTIEKCLFEESPKHLCKKSFVKIPKMSLYQFIHANSIFTCPNMPNGCPMLMMQKFIKQHLAQCDYSNVSKCVFLNCDGFDCNKTEFLSHLKDNHNLETIFSNNAYLELFFESSVRKTNPRRVSALINCHEARFVLNIHEYEERVAMWISLVYGPTTQKYKATFRMPYNKPQNDSEGDKDNGDEDNKVADEDNTAAKDEKVTEEDQITPEDENLNISEKGGDKILSHEIHHISKPIEDIIDLCDCVDMPDWVVESAHLVTDENNHLMWPFHVSIECEECIYDDDDITVEFDELEDDEEVDELEDEEEVDE